MNTFHHSHSRPRTGNIEIDLQAVSSSTPEVQQRMNRILENYQRLDAMLAEIELKISSDERLSAINDSIQEIEITVDGRKRKWHPRPVAKKKKSANPKKPR